MTFGASTVHRLNVHAPEESELKELEPFTKEPEKLAKACDFSFWAKLCLFLPNFCSLSYPCTMPVLGSSGTYYIFLLHTDICNHGLGTSGICYCHLLCVDISIVVFAVSVCLRLFYNHTLTRSRSFYWTFRNAKLQYAGVYLLVSGRPFFPCDREDPALAAPASALLFRHMQSTLTFDASCLSHQWFARKHHGGTLSALVLCW
jgi:hypothetical protein